jgi:hypothetical protein
MPAGSIDCPLPSTLAVQDYFLMLRQQRVPSEFTYKLRILERTGPKALSRVVRTALPCPAWLYGGARGMPCFAASVLPRRCTGR